MASLAVIRAGKAVQLVWTLSALNAALLPALTFVPYDPPSPPLLTIYDPEGNVQLNAQATNRIAPGIYSYTYVTSVTGNLGVWAATLDAVDNNGVPSGSADAADLQKSTPVFQLV